MATATTFHNALLKFGFLPSKGMPDNVKGYTYDKQKPNLWAEVYTDKPWVYMWITGNANKDSRLFPGGKVIESNEALKDYLDNYLSS